MKAQLYTLLQKLIIKNHIQLHQDELKLQLLSHPSYPSLHAVTGVLKHFSIPNLAIKLPTTVDVIKQLPVSFLAVLDKNDNEELVLVERKKGGIKLLEDDKQKKIISEEEFVQQWTGVIIAIEKDESVQETKKEPYSILFKIISIVLLIAGIAGFVVKTPSNFAIAHFLIGLFGIGISILITKHELGIQSNAENNFCNLSEKTSCDAILKSKGALLFGTFKLSDLSLVSFVGFTVSWLLFSIMGISNYLMIGVLSTLAIPFTLYSLYYQSVVVKKWCPLCLGIVAVLWLQFSSLFLSELWISSVTLDPISIVTISLSFVIAIVVWGTLKPMLQDKASFTKLQIDQTKFKRNFSVFKALALKKESHIDIDPIPGELVFGKQNAPIKLTLVTSPFCYYCKEAHKDMEHLLKLGEDKIRLTLRFLANPEQKESDLYKTVSEITHTYHTEGRSVAMKLLHKLYSEDTDIKNWVKERNIHFNAGYDMIMQRQLAWADTNLINFTPALYLNGHLFPNEYERKDILLFMEDLIEQQNNEAHFSSKERLAS